MITVFECALLAIGYLFIFYIWGKTFLKLIGAKTFASENVAFGFIVMHVLYQALYLPFFFARGSYKALSVIWIIASLGITVFCLLYNARTARRRRRTRMTLPLSFFALCSVAFITWLCVLVGLHARPYAADGYYIEHMNQMVNHDVIMHNGGALDYHRGFNSFYGLFAMPCLITGIRPFYVALYTMRFLGVILTSVIAYRTGKTLFDGKRRGVSGYALALSMIVPLAMMFWPSMYTGDFFYMRTNESKAYCQLVLLPLAFFVCAEQFLKGADRTTLWEKQCAIGLAAIPVAASALTSYILLIIICTAALLAYDRFRNAKTTLIHAFACIAPNMIYLILQILH